MKTVKYPCLVIAESRAFVFVFLESGLKFKIVYRKLHQSSLSAARGTMIFTQITHFFCFLLAVCQFFNNALGVNTCYSKVASTLFCDVFRKFSQIVTSEIGIFWHYLGGGFLIVLYASILPSSAPYCSANGSPC